VFFEQTVKGTTRNFRFPCCTAYITLARFKQVIQRVLASHLRTTTQRKNYQKFAQEGSPIWLPISTCSNDSYLEERIIPYGIIICPFG
jgi:hypothetical protein